MRNLSAHKPSRASLGRFASLLSVVLMLCAATTTLVLSTDVQIASAAPITGFTQVTSGGNASCAVKNDATVWCWGRNNSGQLGIGNNTDQSRPVEVTGLTGVTQVEAHWEYACALKSTGTVWCWGNNSFGQLGNGTTTNSNTPVQVSGLSGVTQISTGYGHVCAVKSDATVRCWGWNVLQGLGNGTTTNSSTPITPSGLSGVSKVSASGYGACVLLTDATVRCWGTGLQGQLGDGSTPYSTSTKTQPTGLTGVTNLSISKGQHYCGVLANRSIKCWGYNDHGQIGDGTTNDQLTPVAISGITNIADISANNHTSCAVKTDGTPWCWGWNGYGQLGVGDSADRLVPTAVSGLTAVSQISSGYVHTCAVLVDTTIKCWGQGTYGQLGDGSTSSSGIPVTVSSVSVVLSTPTGVTATATASTSKSISVDWTAVSNASSYSVSLYDSAGTTLLGTKTGITGSSTTLTTSTYSSMTDATQYKVAVTAIGNGTTYVDSSASAKVSVTTNATPTTTTTAAPRVVEIVIQAPATTVPVGQSAIATIAPGSQTSKSASVTTTSSPSSTPTSSVPVVEAPKSTTEAAPAVPKLSAGEGAVDIGGETVKQTLTRKDNQLQIQSGSLVATLSRTTETGATAPLDKDGNLRLEAGDILKISLGGFKPDSQVSAWLFAPGTKLGNAKVKPDGTVSAAFRIPAGVKDGLHRVAVVAQLTNGKAATFTMSVIIGKLKSTSTTTRVLIVVPIVLAVFAGMLLPNRLRRRRSTSTV